MALVLVSLGSYAAAILPVVRFPNRLGTPRARVWLPPRGYRFVTETLAWMQAHVPAGDPLAVVPYEAMYCFLSGRLPPDRYTVLLPPNVGHDGGRDAVAAAEAAGVRWMIETTYPIPGLPPFAEWPAYAAHLRAYHRPVFALRDGRGSGQLRVSERVR